MKQIVADAAIKEVKSDMVLGLGSGSTAALMIKSLASEIRSGKLTNIRGVATSFQSEVLALELDIPLIDLASVSQIDLAIDGADEVTPENFLIKGGGGAHTREKIVAAASNEFICIVDKTKLVNKLGAFPLPLEVIPESRSMVARKIISMGGRPVYRNNFLTDQKNHILDIHDIDIGDPTKLEEILNNIPGVVENGIFASNKPETVLISD